MELKGARAPREARAEFASIRFLHRPLFCIDFLFVLAAFLYWLLFVLTPLCIVPFFVSFSFLYRPFFRTNPSSYCLFLYRPLFCMDPFFISRIWPTLRPKPFTFSEFYSTLWQGVAPILAPTPFCVKDRPSWGRKLRSKSNLSLLRAHQFWRDEIDSF